MNKLTIETTQNVSIEYEIGSLGDRIVATLIDILILFGYYIFIAIVIGAITTHTYERGAAYYTLFIIFILPALLYPLLCETFMNGQSFGKRARKIRVIRRDGRPATFGNYLMRWLIGLIEVNFYGIIAIITIVLNGKGQRLGDIAAGTAVIKIRDKETITSTAFENVQEEYTPVFPAAAKLSDDDANTIRQVLQLPAMQNAYTMQDRLARKLKEYLNIQTTLNNETFLRTLLKDFNKINGRL